LIEAIHGCLLLDPGQQIVHALLERHARFKAKQPAGLGDIGVAMADVAGAKLVQDLGLDVAISQVLDQQLGYFAYGSWDSR
jgi:hypothetical protein